MTKVGARTVNVKSITMITKLMEAFRDRITEAAQLRLRYDNYLIILPTHSDVAVETSSPLTLMIQSPGSTPA